MKNTIDSFLNFLSVEKGFSQNTIAAYRNDLTQFSAFIAKQLNKGELSSHDLAAIDRDVLMTHVLGLREREYALATIARKVAAVKSYFDFLVREDIVKTDPAENLGSIKLGKPLPKTLSVAQIEALLALPAKQSTPEARRDKAMFELLYATGMRATEVVSLNIDNVNLQEGFVRCFGKGSKERQIPIHQQASNDLVVYIEEARAMLTSDTERALFVNQRGQRLTRQGFWLILKNYAKVLGLESEITPHTFRHSIATHLLYSGKMNLRELQEFLGHANISTTQVYTHLTDEHVRKVYEDSHPRAK